MPTKTSLGLDENVAGFLCYLLGWVTGLIFFFLESKNSFVRFHALQSLITFGIIALVYWFFIPGFFAYGFYKIVGILVFVLWAFLMYKAYKGERFKLPLIGDFSERQAAKV